MLFILWPFKRRVGIALAGFFFVLLWLFSTPLLPRYMMRDLQENYAPLATLTEQVDYLAVLGSWHNSDERLSPLLRLDRAATQRLLKAAALMRDQETAKLWLGGSSDPEDRRSHVAILKQAALNLNVDEKRIQLSGNTRNTRAEIFALKQETPPGANIVIISSAFHLKRVALWARHYGLHPLYVPVDLRAAGGRLSVWEYALPRVEHLEDSTRAWHEYLGMCHAYILILLDDLFGG